MKTTKTTEKKPEVQVHDVSELRGTLKAIGGSMSDSWNNILANQTVQSLWLKNDNDEGRRRQRKAAVDLLIGIGPRDEFEGMVAGQLVACHNASMECYRRAMIGEQTFEGRRENLTQASKLSRTYAALLEGLNRHRGKGQQKVTVEHVHVHAGGQAVVGMVEHPGGGDASKLKDQPHARQLTNASQPAMRSVYEDTEALPVGSNAERSVPHARGPVPRSTKGK